MAIARRSSDSIAWTNPAASSGIRRCSETYSSNRESTWRMAARSSAVVVPATAGGVEANDAERAGALPGPSRAGDGRRILDHRISGMGSAPVGVNGAGTIVARSEPPLALAGDARASDALDEHLGGAVGEPRALEDAGDDPDAEEVVGGRVLGLAASLCDQEHELVLAGRRRFGGLTAASEPGASDQQRNHDIREHDDVAQRQHRQPVAGS